MKGEITVTAFFCVLILKLSGRTTDSFGFEGMIAWGCKVVINSRTAITGAIIGLLLVFVRLEEEYWFPLGCFLQEVDLFTRHFDLKAKVRKAVLMNRFSLSERSFLIMRCV